jgi:hypothetical protein
MYAYGQMQYLSGKRALAIQIEKSRVVSMEERTRIENEISKLSDDELLKRALGYVSGRGR